MVVEAAYLIMPSQTNIVTIGFKLTTIRTGSSSAQNTGMQTRNQHIVVFLFKDLERTRKAIVEESEVNTQIIVVDTFPSTHGAHQSGRFHIGSFRVAQQSTAVRFVVVKLDAVIASDTILVTYLTI